MTLSPAPFEDPSMPRTSPSEDPQTFMGPFSFFLVLSALVKLLPKSLWSCVSQRSGYSGSCSGWERCQPAPRPDQHQSLSLCMSVNLEGDLLRWPILQLDSLSRTVFSRRTSATVTCGLFFYKILLLLKTFSSEISSGLLFFLARSHCYLSTKLKRILIKEVCYFCTCSVII